MISLLIFKGLPLCTKFNIWQIDKHFTLHFSQTINVHRKFFKRRVKKEKEKHVINKISTSSDTALIFSWYINLSSFGVHTHKLPVQI